MNGETGNGGSKMNIRASRNGCSCGGMWTRDFSFYYVRIENVEYSEYIFFLVWILFILFIQWRKITNDLIGQVISQLAGDISRETFGKDLSFSSLRADCCLVSSWLHYN